MNSENIASIVVEYIETQNTQYALLLNGGWGTGKTFFWKDTLLPLIQKKNLDTIYISLNGIKTIDALQKQLFFKLIPYFDKAQNKTLKMLATISGNLIKSASKAFIKVDPSDLFQGIGVDNFDFSKKFICFDDLERCRIPMKELLGFINGFVEHKNLKCLILADEDKIFETDENQKTNYYSIKEKVIGRVLNYKPELKSVLPQLFNKYENDNAFLLFLKKNENYIFRIFDEQEEDNIRIISFFLDSLQNIFKSTIDIEQELKKELLFLTAILSVEFKRGFLKSNESEDYKALGNTTHFWYQELESDRLVVNILSEKKEKEPEKEKTYAETFYLKYVSNRLEDYHFYESVYTYVLSGYLNVDKLSKELEKRKPEQPTKEQDAFSNLMSYNFRKFTDDEFTTYTTDVLKYLEEGAYSMYSYEQLSGFYHFFAEKGLIDYTNDEIEKKLFTGIEIASKKKEIDRRFYDNMIHFEVSNPIVQPIRDKIIELHTALDKELIIEESNQLIEVLAQEEYEKLNELFKDKKFNKDFIAHLDGQVLFEALKKNTNQYITLFSNEIKERYKHNNVTMFYPNDYECLHQLRLSIQKHLKEDEIPTLRKFLWLELETLLNGTCEVLKKDDAKLGI
ncbi:P-loop NTPase fold protein [Algibacter pacificus]|uniref:P-loop NTPase fold protein n=1 Tax=Algibacter pacificus TaxID=2599389 RepID=UPI0011C85F25|nr:P-loop NTPase fold protein [Algibacter pacificus]